MRISDWSSDVCSSDLVGEDEVYPNEMLALDSGDLVTPIRGRPCKDPTFGLDALWIPKASQNDAIAAGYTVVDPATVVATHLNNSIIASASELFGIDDAQALIDHLKAHRSEEHTSELQSLMRIS